MRPNSLEFDGGGQNPVQYETWHEGRGYSIRYKDGGLTVALLEDYEFPFVQDIGEDDQSSSEWSMEETAVYLGLISDAIREHRLESLVVPTLEEAPRHPYFVRGPYPMVLAGLPVDWAPPPDLATVSPPFIWVAAEKLDDWIARHPAEHEALRSRFPAAWDQFVRQQRPFEQRQADRPR